MEHFAPRAAAVALVVSFVSFANADPVVWDGPSISFSKAAFADWALPENQDRITDDVWITRRESHGLFNAQQEIGQGPSSPVGTQWAIGTTADLGSLTFDTWLNVFKHQLGG